METVTVLLVDDHRLFLRLAVRFIQEQYSPKLTLVGVAHDGYEALRQAKALQPQVVLLDLTMPGLSGLEVIPRLRAILPEVIIIILTGQRAEGYRRAALAAGADDFIAKATLATDIMPAIRRLVSELL
jgi:two-component system, NarL family, nitrate/nitrite response regulator NarL